MDCCSGLKGFLFSLKTLVMRLNLGSTSHSYFVSHQVGLMLRGMGFNKNTHIYLASGKIYNAERTMAPLLEMFPNLLTKEMLASDEELAPFRV